MFNDVDEMAAEIEKFKNNIAGVDSIAENLKKVHFKLMAQSKKTDELIEAVVKTQADTKQALKDEISKVSQIVNALAEKQADTEQTLKDEISKVSQNVNALSEKQAGTKQTLKEEISKVSQIVNALTEKVEYLCNKQQKDHTLIIVGVILVAIASVTSIVGLFI